MIKFKLKLIFIILIYFVGTNKVLSQSNLKIGLNLQAEELYYRPHISYDGLNLPTINFLLTYNFSKNFLAEFNAGYKLPTLDWYLFNGPEIGISISKKIFFNWLYAKINFTVHYNKEGGHAAQTSGDGIYIGLFPLMGVGVDIFTSNNFALNLMFFKLLKEKIGYSYSGVDEYHIDYIYNLSYLIRFGFSFYWNI